MVNKEEVLHQLTELGLVIAKPMFGGYGLYHEGIFFGLIADGHLYFKTDQTSRQQYIKRGMPGFEFKPNQKAKKTYYEVPVEVFNNPMQLARWAQKAVDIQRRNS